MAAIVDSCDAGSRDSENPAVGSRHVGKVNSWLFLCDFGDNLREFFGFSYTGVDFMVFKNSSPCQFKKSNSKMDCEYRDRQRLLTSTISISVTDR